MNDEQVTETGMVLIPLLWALTNGSFAGVAVSVLSWLFEWDARAGIVAGVLVSTVSWFTFRIRFERLLIGEPEQVYKTNLVRVEMVESGGRTLRYSELPATPEQLVELAEGLLSGASFSEASWSGGGGLFTRAQFRQLRDEMLKRKLLVWNSPHARSQGVSLTGPGWACVRHFAKMAAERPTPGFE